MASNAVPVYFEESWAILSSIGLLNVLFGIMIAGITSLSQIAIVPIIVSAAGAIANGLCYYAFYANYSQTPTVVAAAVADVAWLVQEAGLSFYSYLILIRVLRHPDRPIFMLLFWAMMTILLGLRIVILVSRARQIVAGTTHLQQLIDHLHIGYFSSIAVVEIISAVFLLRKFAAARKTSLEAASKSGSGLFKYLMRSTEIRLAMLALIGITRAVTYSFQTNAQSANSVASQVDRFVYTMECLFPMVMFIDILASKLVVTNHIHLSSSHRAYPKSSGGRTHDTSGRGVPLDSLNYTETRIDAAPMSSSQERIIESALGSAESGHPEDENSGVAVRSGGISKTVEFQFHESAA